MTRLLLALTPLLLLVPVACLPQAELDLEQGEPDDALQSEPLTTTGANADGRTVSQMVFAACSTTSVKGLSQQLVEEINCITPGTFSPLPRHARLESDAAVFPYLQTPAVAALTRALDSRSAPIYLNSALRTLPQQFLLRQWYEQGRCGIGLAARPGQSNHEDGLAIDIDNHASWYQALSGRSFRWLGHSDPVHFDYGGGGKELGATSVLAFQRLWNRNHPEDRLLEDGDYGPATEARLKRSPAIGFPKGASCGDQVSPQVELASVEVYWHRNPDGAYKLRALAPSSVSRVRYRVDGYMVATATRAQGANFPAQYTFNVARRERALKVEGLDAQGRMVALGVGLIDVTPEYGVYIRQLGPSLYSVGLERAPEGVASIEVDVDEYSLGTNLEQDVLEVRHHFSTLGTRQFTLRTYGADGALRGTLRRRFELR